MKLPAGESNSPATPSICGQITGDRSPKGSIKAYKKIRRNLILVGHDVASDIDYLRILGCTALDPPMSNPADIKSSTDQPQFLESIDTSNIFRVLKRNTQASSLAKVLIDLGIAGWHLHNAGNDARYTLEAMVGIALKARLEADRPEDATGATSTHVETHLADDVKQSTLETQPSQEQEGEKRNAAWQAEVERRVLNSQRESESRIREECAMWEAVLGRKGDWDIPNDDVDGGFPSGLLVDN